MSGTSTRCSYQAAPARHHQRPCSFFSKRKRVAIFGTRGNYAGLSNRVCLGKLWLLLPLLLYLMRTDVRGHTKTHRRRAPDAAEAPPVLRRGARERGLRSSCWQPWPSKYPAAWTGASNSRIDCWSSARAACCLTAVPPHSVSCPVNNSQWTGPASRAGSRTAVSCSSLRLGHRLL